MAVTMMNQYCHDQGRRYLFVGGAPRSGTTLVQNILDSHPDICGLPEMHYLEEIILLRKRLLYYVERKMVSILSAPEEIDDYIATNIQRLLDPLVHKYGCAILSEKTPRNVLVFADLLHLFPKARCIYVVRDPRGTIASMFRARAKARTENRQDIPMARMDTKAAIAYYEKCLQAGMQARSKYPEQVLIVKYESLVDDIEKWTKEICQHLGVDWKEEMMRPGEIQHPGEEGMTSEYMSVFYDKQSFYRNPDTLSVEKWKHTLKVSDQVRIANHFRVCRQLVQLGYDFSLDYLPAMPRTVGTAKADIMCLKDWMKGQIKRVTRRLL